METMRYIIMLIEAEKRIGGSLEVKQLSLRSSFRRIVKPLLLSLHQPPNIRFHFLTSLTC